MKNEGELDILIGTVLGLIACIVLLFNDPFLIFVLLPIVVALFIVWTSGTTKRDHYFKAKKALMLTVGVVGGVAILAYYIFDNDFEYFAYNQGSYASLAVILFLVSLFLLWFMKRSVPISFPEDDERLVQETMYTDYEHYGLKEAFAYRGLKFIDSRGEKIKVEELDKAVGEIISTEIDIRDLEMVAVNDNNELKYYYEKLLYDMYNAFAAGRYDAERMQQLYGYSLTIKPGIRSVTQFKKELAEVSLFYSKIFEFLERDMNSPGIKIKLNWKNLYVDNYQCLEFCLISAILMLRQYMNFPVGDLPKYVTTGKDKNFLGCFSSLPADFANVNSTSISPSGIAYYYIYYRMHLDWFVNSPDEKVIARWIQ